MNTDGFLKKELSVNVPFSSFLIGVVGTVLYYYTLTFCLDMPPVWDAAAGVFSPAIYLYENHYDLASLLQLGGYPQGGENVHSFSLITWITALTLSLTGGDKGLYLPLLHSMNFVFAGCIVGVAFNLVRRLRSSACALLVVGAIFISPLMSVQVSYVYTEVAGSLASLLTLFFWVRGKAWSAVFMALGALLVKSVGLFVVVALLALLLIDGLRLGIKWAISRCSCLLLCAIGFEWVKSLYGNTPGMLAKDFGTYVRGVYARLQDVPDLLFVVAAFGVFSLYVLYRMISEQGWRLSKVVHVTMADEKYRLLFGGYVFVSSFLCFVIFVYFSGMNFFPLVRYYVWVLPVVYAFLGVATYTYLYPGYKRLTIGLLSLYFLFLFLSREGIFYPDYNAGVTSFSRLERSFEYKDFYKLQADLLDLVDREYSSEIVYVTRGEYYFSSSPLMGYVSRNLTGVEFLKAPGVSDKPLEEFPDNFILLNANSNGYHGQVKLYELVVEGVKSDDYEVSVEKKVMVGPYVGEVIRIKRS